MEGFEVEKRGTTLVVNCREQVTFESSESLKNIVEQSIASEEFRTVVMDLSKVTFMDSSGIGTLVALNSKVYSAEKKFYLLTPTEQVRKTLELVKLADFFEFIDEPEDLDLIISE